MSKIDIVIMWVDGSDEKWIEKRNKYAIKPIRATQYRDWGTFKYVFRSIEKYAPWVGNVYLVTDNQVPDFLNLDHPKLKIIDHKDFIDNDILPVFSSHPIELNLHKIQGLSERFVYFNDDTFLLSPTKETDFFVNGLPCDTAIINPIAPSFYDSIAGVLVNNISLINDTYKKNKIIKKDFFKWFNYKYGVLNILNLINMPWPRFTGLYQGHLPSSLLKETYEIAWKDHKEVLEKTVNHRFRNNFEDVNQWLLKEIQIVTGKFHPRSPKIGKYIMVRNIIDANKAGSVIKSTKYKMVCINDHCTSDSMEEIFLSINQSFETKFPNKSKFEV